MPQLDKTYYALPVGPYCDIINRAQAAHFGGMATVRVLEHKENWAYIIAVPAFHYAIMALDIEERAFEEIKAKISMMAEVILKQELADDGLTKN